MLIAWRRQTSLTTWQFAVITRIKRRGTKIAKDNENEEERKKKRTLFGRVRLSSAVFKETLENFKIANCEKLLVVSFLPTRFQSFLQFFFFFSFFYLFLFPFEGTSTSTYIPSEPKGTKNFWSTLYFVRDFKVVSFIFKMELNSCRAFLACK